MKCSICQDVLDNEPAVAMQGGFFPANDADIFCPDDDVLGEVYVHINCLKEALRAYMLTVKNKS